MMDGKAFSNNVKTKNPSSSKLLHWHIFGLTLAITLSALVITMPSERAEATRSVQILKPVSDTVVPANSTVSIVDSINSQAISNTNTPAQASDLTLAKESVDPFFTHRLIVQSGDSLGKMLTALEIPGQDIHQLQTALKAKSFNSLVHPKDLITAKTITTESGSSLVELVKPYSEYADIRVIKGDDNKFQAEMIEHNIEKRWAYRSGVITDSLFLSAQRAGLSDKAIMEVTDLFAYSVDFAKDIQPGDSLRVLFEEHWHNDKQLGGEILAAEFVTQGKRHIGIHYSDKAAGVDGFFDEKGKSLKTAFLRSPVEFSRISSYFNLSRRHPILHTIRAHKGVDYAASRGTPIKTTGAGKVIFAGNKGGYGRTVVVQHGDRYTTLYAHLNTYASKMRVGKQVSQGDVIGYVGSSGLATGPHLHYEFQVNNRHVDPLKVKLPRNEELTGSALVAFQSKTYRIDQLMAGYQVGEIAYVSSAP
ncbi:MAG: peptidoglycan DD-metalloendopeptidase family protein [Pseudomonadota bacterium]